MKANRIKDGVYEYRGYILKNRGYHHPDHCVWWEAIGLTTNCGDFHATTKKDLMKLIDEDIENELKNIV